MSDASSGGETGQCASGTDRPIVEVDTLDHQATETHECSIEGKITRDYYDCPNCGFPISKWMDCPECRWYDEEAWERTIETGGEPA